MYIHAKLLIVDDLTCCIGSANINDRSLIGDRDSECNILLKDTNEAPAARSQFGGRPAKVPPGANVRAFRLRCMNQHLGLERGDETMLDPLTKEAHSKWDDAARHNAKVRPRASMLLVETSRAPGGARVGNGVSGFQLSARTVFTTTFIWVIQWGICNWYTYWYLNATAAALWRPDIPHTPSSTPLSRYCTARTQSYRTGSTRVGRPCSRKWTRQAAGCVKSS